MSQELFWCSWKLNGQISKAEFRRESNAEKLFNMPLAEYDELHISRVSESISPSTDLHAWLEEEMDSEIVPIILDPNA
jgi:hypothetical protein